jgi:hypothetical protein
MKEERLKSLGSLAFLFCLTILFYWKILFTRQYSMFVFEEGVRQTYSWLTFLVTNLRHGHLPLWDSLTMAGTCLAGETQTGLYYPLHWLLALVPLNRQGMFSPQLYHQWYAFAHFLGACFMYALVREFRLSRFAAIVAGICFSMGGFVAYASWPHMYESAIWLPLVFLFLMRAMRAPNLRQTTLNASAAGLGLGLTMLAGGFHIAIMQTFLVSTFAVFVIFNPQLQQKLFAGKVWAKPLIVLAVFAGIGVCAGAVQLLPAWEYGSRALRWYGDGTDPLLGVQKVPYYYVDGGFHPHGFLTLVMPQAFGGLVGKGETVSPYLSLFALIAILAGILKKRHVLWVRYLTGVAVAAFLYALGGYSLLNGLVYSLIPFSWVAREPGRFICLASFALPVVAAFGIDSLLESSEKSEWSRLNRVLLFVSIAGAIALAIPAVSSRQINPWISLSILLYFFSYWLFCFVIGGHKGKTAKAFIVILLLFDLSAFNWTARSKHEEIRQGGTDHFERLMSLKDVAQFLKSKPGPFRVELQVDPKPNIGHVFGVPILEGTGVTALKDYFALRSTGNTALFNNRYILRPASAEQPGPVYQDSNWKVYENPNAYPAAWVVHETIVEPSVDRIISLLWDKKLDLHHWATLSTPLLRPLEPLTQPVSEPVSFLRYEPNRLELSVEVRKRGLLVLSENDYPGWHATVNGKETMIHGVDGALRAIEVDAGMNRVVLRYFPRSIFFGGLLTLAAFIGTLLAFGWNYRNRNKILPQADSSDTK